MYQMLKCLTAVKLCRHLVAEGVQAVPVCWIGEVYGKGPDALFVSILDSRGEIHRLNLHTESNDLQAGDLLPPDGIVELLKKLEELGGGIFDFRILETLKSSYHSGETLASAAARLVSDLMREWGLIVLNPHSPRFLPYRDQVRKDLSKWISETGTTRISGGKACANAGNGGTSSGTCHLGFVEQSLMLPVIASIVNPCELAGFIEALPLFEIMGMPAPVAWPQPGATVVDMRSRRTLAKYQLAIHDLFSGEREATEKFKLKMPDRVLEKLGKLIPEVETSLQELGKLFPGQDEIVAPVNSCKRKIVYQIEKLKELYRIAVQKKHEAAERQIHRACNLIAPCGRMQEIGLSGIYFLLRHSRSVLQFLYENLDVMKFEHQILLME